MSYKNCRFHLILFAMIALCGASAFAAAPTISGFSPATGTLGTVVTITGTNFVAPVTVSFGGAASTSVTVVSTTSVKATVPGTAPTGTITLATSGGSATSTSAFTVLPGVAVTVAVGPPTTALVFYYSGYGAREAVDLYFDEDNLALGTTSANGAGNLAISIPAAARPGVHWLTAVGRNSGTAVQVSFTVRASWPQFGFAPNHKGKNRYENVLSPATVGDLDEAWRTPKIGAVISTPAVVNGIVYATFNDGSIRAFDETTGAQKWSYPTGGTSMSSSPAVANGIVYAGSNDQYLYALDAVTGAQKWRYYTFDQINSSPTVVNGIVYFGSDDYTVYAVNATTGALVWNFGTSNYVDSSPLVANGVLYIGSDDGKIYAVNAATGASVWTHATGYAVMAPPVIVGGLICVGAGETMDALDASTGAVRWTYNAGGVIYNSPAVAGGALFFSCTDGKVYSLTSNGALRWSMVPLNGGPMYCPVCVANGVAYATDGQYTYAFDQNSGAVLATLPVGSNYGGAAVVNGAVFAGDITDDVLTRYTPNALLSNFVAPRPDPRQLRPHPLR